jgi:hypothetical protein
MGWRPRFGVVKKNNAAMWRFDSATTPEDFKKISHECLA